MEIHNSLGSKGCAGDERYQALLKFSLGRWNSSVGLHFGYALASGTLLFLRWIRKS